MTADVIIFPSRFRIGYARHIARTGQRMPKAWQRKSYWNHRVDDFCNELAEIGVLSADIADELAEFTELVRREAKAASEHSVDHEDFEEAGS